MIAASTGSPGVATPATRVAANGRKTDQCDSTGRLLGPLGLELLLVLGNELLPTIDS